MKRRLPLSELQQELLNVLKNNSILLEEDNLVSNLTNDQIYSYMVTKPNSVAYISNMLKRLEQLRLIKKSSVRKSTNIGSPRQVTIVKEVSNDAF